MTKTPVVQVTVSEMKAILTFSVRAAYCRSVGTNLTGVESAIARLTVVELESASKNLAVATLLVVAAPRCLLWLDSELREPRRDALSYGTMASLLLTVTAAPDSGIRSCERRVRLGGTHSSVNNQNTTSQSCINKLINLPPSYAPCSAAVSPEPAVLSRPRNPEAVCGCTLLTRESIGATAIETPASEASGALAGASVRVRL